MPNSSALARASDIAPVDPPVITPPVDPGRAAMLVEFGVKRHARVVLARLRATGRKTGRAALRRRGNGAPLRSVYGVDLVANFGDKTFRYCLYGTYGNYFSDFLKRQRQPFTFLDIGANQGLYSLIAGTNPACTQVLSFEPVGRTHALLGANLAVNGLSGKARAINAGVSDRGGTAEICVKPGHSGVSSLDRPGSDGFGATETITLVSGSDIAGMVGGTEPVIVKIDVEGHEATVVKALAASPLIDRVAAVFYEMDERWADAAAVEATLRAAGFTRFRKHGLGRHYDVMALR